MVPLGKTTPTTSTKKKTRTRGRKLTRSNIKNQHLQSKQQETSSENCSSNMDSVKVVDDVSITSNSLCSTPKGKKFRIPEISTCPPAPKKQRVLSNFSLRRSFFATPDLEKFLCVALQDSLASFVC
ncbi:hypothetical protein MtrunA17_Chr5g0447241 [Medicago truncatula]|uniref:Uncharacterized protein n=1 Tax=Medicago truncatula TaxID=3880 RepID=A0A072UH85_MEDTR|nr:hypothetical protein MTR_5g096855 [Medicago truncatula]RHN58078.1 hypothetical protein MtrunA17_Chr5g0447241 [Medicago truncatula]